MGRRRKRKALAEEPEEPRHFRREWLLILAAIFVAALAPRLYGALTFGRNLEGPGTFTLINFDEGGSCRAVVGDFRYPRFLGYQTVALGKLFGFAPPAGERTDARGRRFCHQRGMIMLQRSYSAVVGALTVVLTALIALLLWPSRPAIAWTAAGILGLSNFHIAESHWATVDVSQVFYVYLLIATVTYGFAFRSRTVLFCSLLLLVPAIWTKWYVFAVLAYAPFLLSRSAARYLTLGFVGMFVGVAIGVVLFGWDDLVDVFVRRGLLWGNDTSRFGTGYANIGTWRRWIRNSTNLPIVHLVGLGLPACLFVWHGLRNAIKDSSRHYLWLAQAPAIAYAVYMLLLGPVTYYRYYLPLFPSVALLAAYGLWQSRWCTRRGFLVFFFLYPALLTLDSEYNLRQDPRRNLPEWYAEHPTGNILASYYVTPMSRGRTATFRMDGYVRFGHRYLERVSYLILSEAWYDTSQPNELNGPIAWKPEWLIKTRPEFVRAYRKILAGEDPNLEPVETFKMHHFTPELLLHRFFYGSFPLLTGDVRIFRVRQTPA